MHYFDSSFIVPLFLREFTSDSVEEFINSNLEKRFTICDLTKVELASAVSREFHTGNLSVEDTRDVIIDIHETLRKSFKVVLPSRADYNQARNWLNEGKIVLKASDALHLSIAANNDAEAIYSFDKALVMAGRKLGLPTTAAGILNLGAEVHRGVPS